MKFTAVTFLRSYGLGSQLPPCDGVEVVFCGRSNVGKSTMINCLAGRRSLARVSATPGKTTTINQFRLGDGVYLMDLPGYGYAKRPQAEIRRWAELLEAYFTTGRRIALCVLLLDCRRTPSADDITMLECFRIAGLPFMIAVTKTDKLNKTELAASLTAIKDMAAPYGPSAVCSFSERGESCVEELRAAISQAIEAYSGGNKHEA